MWAGRMCQVVADTKERGAGDWQHYKPPSAVLKEVAARNAQPRLTAPGPPGPPPLQVCLQPLKLGIRLRIQLHHGDVFLPQIFWGLLTNWLRPLQRPL